MSIGTTVKLSMDMKSVQRGLSALPRMFSKSMGFLGKNVIGGAAQKLGHGITDLLTSAVMAVPNGIKDLTEYAGTLVDVSTQTKVAVKDLMVLEEAMRLSGADGDIARMISTFGKNLRSGMTEEGGPNDALRRLGFSPDEFKGMKVDEAFKKIGMRAKDLVWEVGELEEVMSSLFGGRMGPKLIRFFDDFSGNMEKAKKNVGEWGAYFETQVGKLDDAGDNFGRYRGRWLQLMELIASSTGISGSGSFIDRAFDWLNPEKIRKAFEYLRTQFARAFEVLSTEGFSGAFGDLGTKIGAKIGEGFKASMGEMFSPSSWLKPFTGKDKPTTGDKTTSQLIELNKQQARSLAKIERSGFPALAV